MNDERKNDGLSAEEHVTEAQNSVLSNDDLDNVTGGAAPKKMNVSAGVIAGNKLGGMTPQYPAIAPESTEPSAELSEGTLDAIAGGSASGSGKVQMQDFHFVKKVDKSSAKLF